MRGLASIVLSITLLVPVARADEASTPLPVVESSRRLDGMIYIPSRLVRDPFINTSFGLLGQYGLGTAEGPGFDVLGHTVGRRTYQLGELSGGLTFSGAMLPWLSLRLGLENVVISGVNAASALIVGQSAFAGGNVGLTGSWAVGDNLRVGFLVDGRDRERIELIPLGPVAAGISDGAVELTGLAPVTNNLTISGGGVIAVGLARCFAADLTLEYTYSRIQRGGSGTEDNAHDLRLGAVAELDLARITPVPLGFVASYRLDNAFESGDTIRENHVDFGLYYTGRPNVVLGVNGGGDFLTIRNGLDIRAVLLSFVLTYYWA